ncbi:GNAT family N-acetyltransferase [Tepidibacillus sp. HK-1]|uniref:GNAT family N-acetyltransferase n=1 Tax=Tepidibacillus sp. HK-1 TaxID=1883407 RepID=UPI0008535F8D|nr:GNAT family N-acetyltransferase [Tepidibacillus sp. HK-1]GBF11752.1 hypothetical protein HK1_01791 [Tepidibacillus sp. HK-1]
MRKVKINASVPERFKQPLIRFINKYGDGHITRKAIEWLKKTPFQKLNQSNGDLIHVILEGKKIIGVLAIARFGLDQAIIVVHPEVRKQGVAYQLVTEALEDIDRYYVKVANDNVPSLKLCFAAGMKAFDLTKGPTGKPTFVLGIGNWDASEWAQEQK